ncbi:MAG: porin family protein, partial [Chitinophagaceae bacterium]|nr:porin family protein [Chitinophagaceae bacterium]
LAFILLVLSDRLFAQMTIEVHIGVSCNNNYQRLGNSYNIGKSISSAVGFQINKPLKKKWLINFGIAYIPKNYDYKAVQVYSGLEQKISNRYLQLNALGFKRIQFTKKTGIDIGGGFFGGYLLSRKFSGALPNLYTPLHSSVQVNPNNTVSINHFSEKISIDEKFDNRFEFGLRASIGVRHRIKRSNWVKLSANYDYALTDQEKQYMYNQSSKKNRTLSIAIGYEFQIQKK